MTHRNQHRCRTRLIHRYRDGETTPSENEWIKQHLEECQGCKDTINTLQRLSKGVMAKIGQAHQKADFVRLERSVVQQIRQRSRRRIRLPFGKILIPLTAAAIVFGVVLGLPAWQISPTEPSAIVSSFAGDSSSIMVFETPDTHRTVIWINETADRKADQSRAPHYPMGYRTS